MTNQDKLRRLIKAGLTFAQCTEVFAERLNKGEEATIEAATREWHREGEVEIEDVTVVSRSDANEDEGAYVMAWVWIADSER